jgi:hypothetical protein
MCSLAEEATQMNFKLKALVSRSDARTIRHALGQLPAKGSVSKADDEFVVEAEMEGASARELNPHGFFRLEKGGEENDAPCGMPSDDGTTERFFD